jgi:phospholipid N-methyltransferase
MQYWQTCGRFIQELCRDFRQTGAVLPSSRFLARALAKHLKGPRPPARILEVGAGTGAITAAIVRYLRPGDRFDIVEINGRFVELLRRRFATEKRFRGRLGQLHLIHSGVEDLPGSECYDYIVSCLPLNNFPADHVRQIFRVFQRLLAKGGRLTFFEYSFIRQLKTPFVGPRERRRLALVGRTVKSFVKDYQVARERVLANIPPALVRHLHLKGQPHPLGR